MARARWASSSTTTAFGSSPSWTSQTGASRVAHEQLGDGRGVFSGGETGPLLLTGVPPAKDSVLARSLSSLTPLLPYPLWPAQTQTLVWLSEPPAHEQRILSPAYGHRRLDGSLPIEVSHCFRSLGPLSRAAARRQLPVELPSQPPFPRYYDALMISSAAYGFQPPALAVIPSQTVSRTQPLNL